MESEAVLNILLVDSDAVLADRIKSWLPGSGGGGISVTHVDRLGMALRMLSSPDYGNIRHLSRPIHAAVLNLSVPDCGGPSGFARLTAALPNVPVIALTTRLSERHTADVRRLGALDCLSKERVDEDAVLSVLERIAPPRLQPLIRTWAAPNATRRAPLPLRTPAPEPEPPTAYWPGTSDSDVVAFTCTLEGRIESWSPGAERLYGAKTTQLADLLPADELSTARNLLKSVNLGTHVTGVQQRRSPKDGSTFSVQATVFPFFDPDGHVTSIAFVERPIPASVPVSPTPEADAEAEAPRTQDQPADHTEKPLVMVVEDNDVSRRLIQRMLERDYRVETAATATEALTLATQHVFDVLLLDINLQERRTGVEILHALRRAPTYRKVPAVACTAYALPGFSERLMEHGFNAFVAKPFTRQTLIDAINSVLKKPVEAPQPQVGTEPPDLVLPPRPSSLADVAEMLSDENGADIERLVTMLESDPVVASWVLHHVNSAFYSLRGNVASVERAVTLLGFEPICNLVLSKVLSRAFAKFEVGKPARVYDYLQRTCVAAGAYARALAEHLEIAEAELSFTGGLLHQLGRLGLLSAEPEKYAALWFRSGGAEDEAPVPPSVGQELLHLGADHEALGVQIAREWQLPKKLAFVIQRQSKQPARAVTPEALLALTVAAGAHASRNLYSAHVEQEVDQPNAEALDEVLKVLARRFERSAPELREYLHTLDAQVRELVGKIVSG